MATVLPEVPKPIKKLSLNEKLFWTGIALALYLIMAQTPLYGVPTGGADPLAYTRIIFASAQGTLMELGIGPIVTAGLILQLLKGAEIIKIDFKKPEDRALFTSATKLLTIIVALIESSAYIVGGFFGSTLSPTAGFIITMQLLAGTIVVMLLDEMVQKGWGIGSGISLFILAGVAQRIMWDIFSPLPAGNEPFGLIPFLINSTIHNRLHATIIRAGGLPSLSTFALTLLVMFIIIYIEGMRIEIPITSIKFRGFSGVYPIKLLYTSNVPIILVSALLTNITFFSQQIWARYNPLNNNQFLNWLVMYNRTNIQAGPIGGLVYFLTPVHGLDRMMAEPLRAITYALFVVFFSVIFAKLWVDIGGLSPKAAAKSLVDAQLQVPGFRRVDVSLESMLSRYIPTITIISGIIIGLIAATSEILGVFGSGIGILLMIGIIIQYYQLLLREQLETMMPRLGALLGIK